MAHLIQAVQVVLEVVEVVVQMVLQEALELPGKVIMVVIQEVQAD
jgi:phenylpyruvate tautomerase PptA (4-oxalocrotonate tautomerase family)